MKTGITPILAFLLGASVMYNFKPGYNLTELANANKNGNVTIIPNATFINSSIGEMKEERLQSKANFTLIGKVQDNLGHCQDNLTEIQNTFTKLTNNYLLLRQEMKEELGHSKDDYLLLRKEMKELGHSKDDYLLLRQEMKEELGHSKDDYLLLRRDMQIVTGQQEIANSDSIGNIWLFLFGSALEGLIFTFVGKWWLSRQNTTQDRQKDNTDNGEIPPRPSKLLKQVPLDRSVCIVSFYEETQELHLRLAKSAIQTDITVKQFLIKELEAQLMSIPRSRFILVFVNYNETNIILETPGQDLRDKKLVTIQAAQKMGADVIVVYVRDRGSFNLPDGVLYNTNLASLTMNPTLGKLTVRDRGLSVYETFTDYQKSHINGIIS